MDISIIATIGFTSLAVVGVLIPSTSSHHAVR